MLLKYLNMRVIQEISWILLSILSLGSTVLQLCLSLRKSIVMGPFMSQKSVSMTLFTETFPSLESWCVSTSWGIFLTLACSGKPIFNLFVNIFWLTSIDKMKENGFKLTKERSRRYPAKTITDADYIALLANVHAQAKTLLYSLERTTAGIDLHVNEYKMEYMSFNQTGDISTLNSSSLKLVDKFTYLGSSVSSTKTDINMWLAKAWTAIDKLLIIWKSDLTDKIKCSFF